MKKVVAILLVLALSAAVVPFGLTASAEHRYEVVSRVEPTCTEDGYIDYLCSGSGTETLPVKITGASRLSVSELLAYSAAQIPNMRLTCTPEELIGLYLSIGAKYGIRGDIAYLQAVKETGWFKFNRPNSYLAYVDGAWVRIYEPRPEGLYVVPTDNNFCGLGVTGKLGDEGSLCRFATAALGVTAHIQHLFAYATELPLPVGETVVDPRFTYMRRGCADTWTELGNDKWTSSPTYGDSIVNSWLSALENYAECYGDECGETMRETLPATGHSFSEWVTVLPPTPTTAGVKTRVCTVCLERETEEIPCLVAEYGDIDCNGEITVSDALLVLRVAAKLVVLDEGKMLISDVDYDGVTGIADALLILRAATGIEIISPPDYPSGRAVSLTSVSNETFRAVPNDSDTSMPQYYWLPQGAVDYITGESVCSYNAALEYYTLRCGLRVYKHDSLVTENACLMTNGIMAASLKSEGKYTYLTVAGSVKTPYLIKTDGLYPADTNATTASSASFTRLDIIMTSSCGGGSFSFGESPLFSAGSAVADENAKTVTYSLTLKRAGIFCGYDSYYDDNGNLVIRMHNPPDVSGGRLDGTVICLDAGHGGYDTGASGYLIETDENLKVVFALRAKLESLGATVYLTRDNHLTYTDGAAINKNTYQAYRVALIASFEPDILISVHHNWYSDPGAHGTESLYFYGFNQGLAQTVSNSMSAVSGMRNRGGKYQNVFVYRCHSFMSILLECGFLSNEGDTTWLAGEGNTDRLAGAVADGIITYFS